MAANEIANRSHVGLVLEMFEDAPSIILASWGLDVATLAPLAGATVIRMTQPLSLAVDEAEPQRLARFSFAITVQSLALPNFARAGMIPDPFGPPPSAPAPGESVALPWLALSVTDASGDVLLADAVLNVEVRRVPTQRRGS